MTSDAYFGQDRLATLPDAGRRFKVLRKRAGKTQTEVATAVGMRQEALSRFESGASPDFSLARLLRLLQVLDLELEFRPTTRHPTLQDVLDDVKHGRNTGPDSR
jgi:transcriptional regulator with XRE-family HTH domain